MRIVAQHIEPNHLVENGYRLKPVEGEGEIAGTFKVQSGGVFVSQLALDGLVSFQSWYWQASIRDASGRGIERTFLIEIQETGISFVDVQITGIVEIINPTHIKLVGEEVALDDSTRVFDEEGRRVALGILRTGMKVTVSGRQYGDGQIVANLIHIRDAGTVSVQIEGLIEDLGVGMLLVNGQSFSVTDSTRIIDELDRVVSVEVLKKGMRVQVEGLRYSDGVHLAQQIRRLQMKPNDTGLPAFIVNLEQNYPNPFIDQTIITFSLIGARVEVWPVRLKVYDVIGRPVATLIERMLPAGKYTVTWDGHDDQRRPLPGGSYIIRLQIRETDDVRIMVRSRE